MHPAHPAPDTRRSFTAGLLLGIGIMAAVDEIVFHQLLAWHHFFDRSTPVVGLISDGLLHSAEIILLVIGFFMLGDLRAGRALHVRRAWGGFLCGSGGFQLFDGLVNHKVLGLHQIRYVDDLLIYDLVWNGAGLVVLLIGIAVTRGGRASAPAR